ncbi:DNA polymerase eta [Gracilariopsis chorda]|uniref:DNA polymerase eta n=1 Tax=Gracilariopsis chorda TaxID=448386 RepID=A0A2V3J7X8_9FLOR|nr:DNA polymerase eta [Gracilariopsis chorda]|eukprot:PXF49957.1 DNA polymerase eta [Gracilariopsis chorda]
MIVGDKLDMSIETDMRLAHGADIAKELRHRVFLKCNYTVSAGISFNKLLAKFASAKNKPNRQTILPFSAVPELMKNVPLRKLRGLGGKLGKQIEQLGVHTAGEATKLDMDTLERKLGKRKIADFVYKCVRGLDETEVVERESTKSLLAAKNFKDENSLITVEKQWLPLLADELNNRIIADSEANSRDARTLTISFRAKMTNGYGRVNASRSTTMPQTSNLKRTGAIVAAALLVLKTAFCKESQFAFPISFIGLTATNFSERATQGESIRSYFDIADQKSGKSNDFDSPKKALSSADREEEYRKRVQESADRELALKLHREESSRGIRKTRTQNSNRALKRPGPKRRKRSAEFMTVDMFFKPKNRKT